MKLSPITFSIIAIAAPRASTAFSVRGRCGTVARHHPTHTTTVAPHYTIDRLSRLPSSSATSLHATESDPSDDDTNDESSSSPPSENSYANPDYPELEFVNYDDPNYTVDQGVGDEVYEDRSSALSEDATLAEIESMREYRRKRNDEYQFETYHANILRGGERSLGEWTVFQTDTFMGAEVVEGRHPEAKGVPRLLKWDRVLKVVSRGSKIVVDPNAEWRVDGERIVHEERLATVDDFPTLMMMSEDGGEEDDDDNGEEGGGNDALLKWESEDVAHVENTFWPSEMTALDFRGPGGIMCVGKAYTICDARPLNDDDGNGEEERHDGPFREMRTELGIQENGMRFRVKLDYGSLEEDIADGSMAPPLHLRTLTVCRETLDGYWPDPSDNEKLDEPSGDDNEKEAKKSEVQRRNQEEITAALFGPPGAQGGLYDPPPVGSEERAVENYMLLDFEGGATLLLPHRLDQYHPEEGTPMAGTTATSGWVTSLDWTPGNLRYQVDRKVLSGTKIKGLKTLELSEVQSGEADKWRPKDGGADMRQ